jgi:hypothetical protein
VNKGGNLIPIREELEKKFQETGKLDLSKLNSNDPIEIPTIVSQKEGEFKSEDIVTLRIRTETGKRTLIVKLIKTDKIGRVYELVKPYVEFEDRKFELRTKFPNRGFERGETKDLGELKLAPSSALVVHSI